MRMKYKGSSTMTGTRNERNVHFGNEASILGHYLDRHLSFPAMRRATLRQSPYTALSPLFVGGFWMDNIRFVFGVPDGGKI